MACSALGEQECAIIADSRNTTRAYNTYEGLKKKKYLSLKNQEFSPMFMYKTGKKYRSIKNAEDIHFLGLN